MKLEGRWASWCGVGVAPAVVRWSSYARERVLCPWVDSWESVGELKWKEVGAGGGLTPVPPPPRLARAATRLVACASLFLSVSLSPCSPAFSLDDPPQLLLARKSRGAERSAAPTAEGRRGRISRLRGALRSWRMGPLPDTALDATVKLVKVNFYNKLRYADQDWEDMKIQAKESVLNRSLKRTSRMSKPGSSEWEHDEISAFLLSLQDPYTRHMPKSRFGAKILATQGGQYGLGCELQRTWNTSYLHPISRHLAGRLGLCKNTYGPDKSALSSLASAAFTPSQEVIARHHIGALAILEIILSKFGRRRAPFMPVGTALVVSSMQHRNVFHIIEVSQVVAGSAAERAGLQAGDKVIAVDSHPYPDLNLERVNDAFMSRASEVSNARLQEGQRVFFDILRSSSKGKCPKLLQIEIQARKQPLVTLEWRVTETNMGNRRLGVLHLKSFSGGTAYEVERALREMRMQDVSGIVMDLRKNGGGSLPVVVDIASLFLPPDLPVMHLRNGEGTIETLSTSRHGRQPIFLDVPMVCITDEETASAAEVLVGCLKDQRRCYAIGERTYGKGLAQGLYKLPDGSGLAISTLSIATPSGLEYNGIGIQPHERVENVGNIRADDIRPWQLTS